MRHAAEKLNDFNGRIRIVEPLSYASDTVTAHRRMVWTADNPESSKLPDDSQELEPKIVIRLLDKCADRSGGKVGR